MGRLHLHLRRLALLTALLGALAACGSDETEVPDRLRGETTCMWVADTMISFEDGSSKLLSHPDTRITGAACTCMTQEQWEAGEWKAELNAQALEICEELAALYDNVASTECQEKYESGRWFSYALWNAEDIEPAPMWDPGCVGE